MRIRVFAVLGAAIIAGGCSPQRGFDPDRERAEVVETVNTSIKWCFPDKSRERLYGSVIQDSTFFMYQPDSRATIIGFDAFKDYSERVFMVDECQPKGSEIRNLRVNLSGGGDVAWFSCLLDDWGEWAGTPWLWKDTRWTGVLRKIDGKWVMVQQHFSLAEDAVRAEVKAELGAPHEGE